MKILIWFRRWLDRLKEQRQLLEQKQEQRRRNAAVIAAQLVASAITRPGLISEPIEVNRLRNFGAVSPRLVYNLVADELRERTQSFDLKWFEDVSSSTMMWFTASVMPSTGYKPLTEK